ncbi:VWA domain-containing protein [Rheinheimera sp. WS51]|uniref:vWA domain-containing protein n=1 Tax=Rheinheimera sp. WS51 TaxID=3425886 RepID=UPI003D935309
MFAEFHFLRPLWLLTIVPAIILIFLLYFYRRDQSPWHNLIAPHLQPLLLSTKQVFKSQPLLLPSLLVCWLITSIALAGPSWQKLPQPAFALKKATVLVLDMSMSMRATDMSPDRLTQQRFLALDFTEQLKEGELGLLSFAGDAFTIAPLTPDHNNISLLIPDLQPEIMPEQGSNLLAALQQADKLLTQAGYPSGDVVVFTDGFDNNSYIDIQKTLNNWPHRLSILGFGTSEGAPIKLANGELLKNSQGSVIMPKLPQLQLASLARRNQGVYANATIDGKGIKQILKQAPLTSLNSADELQQIKGDQWQDSAVYLVWLLIPLVLWQRRMGAILAILLVVLPSQQAQAAQSIEWRDLWQTKQQQAEQDYKAGDFQAAKDKFTDPLWQGNAAYRAGDYKTAEQAFRQATTSENSSQSWHNLGNSLAQQSRYADAEKAYQQALSLNPNLAAAEKNAKLMQKLLEQQKQQQQSDNENSTSDQDKQQSDQQDKQQQESNQEQDNNDNDNDSSNENSAENQQSENTSTEQDGANKQTPNDAKAEQQKQAEENKQQEAEMDKAEQTENEQQQQQAAITEAWPDASPEEQQQLNNLLRKVQDDPALLLRNKMYLEYQKRKHQRLPKGVDQQW